MLDKLEAISERFFYLEEQLSDPEVISDISKFTKYHKEYKDLAKVVEVKKVYEEVLGNIATAKEMLSSPDPEMKEMAQDELNDLGPKLEEVEEEIKVLLIPKDPEDSKDVIFEIRSGTGGDEASIFVGDLFRMYSKYFENQKWKQDVLYSNEGTSGGYNKIVIEVTGNEVFGKLKFESGAHRVQRVPQTESQGRVHTSAATVAVMPKFEMEEIDVRKDELKVDTFRSSGAGGQHVNKTESGVRFTHLPTGIVAESTDGRSQIKMRNRRSKAVSKKLKDVQRQEITTR
ncbi:UNVERIFIED_CONTAM: hypothetical protein GTU68_053318 [Idotea baltica]|nr:hypothetical protein [Idotea baltica]